MDRKQILSISACTASSGGRPPYLVKGLSLPFYGDNSEETPQPLETSGFKRAFHCSQVDSSHRAKVMTTKLFTSNEGSHEACSNTLRQEPE
eukprot:1226594-Karenia_brevis.AAC.1